MHFEKSSTKDNNGMKKSHNFGPVTHFNKFLLFFSLVISFYLLVSIILEALNNNLNEIQITYCLFPIISLIFISQISKILNKKITNLYIYNICLNLLILLYFVFLFEFYIIDNKFNKILPQSDYSCFWGTSFFLNSFWCFIMFFDGKYNIFFLWSFINIYCMIRLSIKQYVNPKELIKTIFLSIDFILIMAAFMFFFIKRFEINKPAGIQKLENISMISQEKKEDEKTEKNLDKSEFSIDKSNERISIIKDENINCSSPLRKQENWKIFLEEMPVGMLILSSNIQDVLFVNKTLIELFEKTKEFLNNEEMYDFSKINKVFTSIKKITNLSPQKKEKNHKIRGKKRTFSKIDRNNNLNDLNLDKIIKEIKSDDNSLKKNFNFFTRLNITKDNAIDLEKDNSFEKKEKYLSIELHISQIKFEKQQSFLILFEDISKQEKLHNLKKNDEFKNRLLSSFSHELRTPLNGANSPLEMCINDPQTPQYIIDKYLKNVYVSLQLLENFLNDIVDYSQLLTKGFQLNIDEILLERFIEEIKGLIIPQCSFKNIEIVIENEIDAKFVLKNDSKRIKQVFLNILSNSLKFTTKGKIFITIKFLENFRNHFVKFQINDTGIGMSETQIKELTKILNTNTNETVTMNSTGNGLGLTITQQILKKLNTKRQFNGLNFNSVLNEGSEFSFVVENFLNYDSSRSSAFDSSNISESYTFTEKGKSSISKSSKRSTLIPRKTVLNRKTIALTNTYSDQIKEIANDEIELDNYPYIKQQKHNKTIFIENKNIPEKYINEVTFDKEEIKRNFFFDRFKRVETKDLFDLDVRIPEDNRENEYNEKGHKRPSLKKESYSSIGNTIESHQDIYIFETNNKNLQMLSEKTEALLVDDDGFNLMSLEMILKKLKVVSSMAFNGKEALENVIQNPKKYKFILMDFQMPLMDGVESTKCIKEFLDENELPDIPIFACTAFSSKNDQNLCLSAGMLECITKPVSYDKIKSILFKYNII